MCVEVFVSWVIRLGQHSEVKFTARTVVGFARTDDAHITGTGRHTISTKALGIKRVRERIARSVWTWTHRSRRRAQKSSEQPEWWETSQKVTWTWVSWVWSCATALRMISFWPSAVCSDDVVALRGVNGFTSHCKHQAASIAVSRGTIVYNKEMHLHTARAGCAGL